MAAGFAGRFADSEPACRYGCRYNAPARQQAANAACDDCRKDRAANQPRQQKGHYFHSVFRHGGISVYEYQHIRERKLWPQYRAGDWFGRWADERSEIQGGSQQHSDLFFAHFQGQGRAYAGRTGHRHSDCDRLHFRGSEFAGLRLLGQL